MRRTERRYNSQPESQRRLQPEYVERRLSGTVVHFEVAGAGRSSHGRRSGRAGPSTVHRQ